MNKNEFNISCTGDVVSGDVIMFEEAVFGGSYRRPKYLGDRTIFAKVLKDSYGDLKQQHTFSIEVLDSVGFDPLPKGKRTRRKGRNIYRNETWRLPWKDEAERDIVAEEKHQRGEMNRKYREARRLAELRGEDW